MAWAFSGSARDPGWLEFVTRASGPNAVVICACDPQGRVLFVEQYRVPLGRRVLEFPAGLVGDDASTGDDILATAQQELIEECGYEAGLQLFGSGPVSAGLTDETLFRWCIRLRRSVQAVVSKVKRCYRPCCVTRSSAFFSATTAGQRDPD